LVGASPEVNVRLTGKRCEIRPIAGTRPRGGDETTDKRLEAELLADPKERSEHLMLVDLARNDLGRVCKIGSVHVPDYAIVERYSHVMHIVSQVEGELAEGKNAFDLFRATFPAGTLTGAPKVRAMQIISELEGQRRGIYGGAVGYFGFDGGHDSCIVIRTAFLRDGVASVQAGAGVVSDSVPTLEFEETLNKSKGVLRALGLASTLRQRS
jgi:anthranilate synthase component 1